MKKKFTLQRARQLNALSEAHDIHRDDKEVKQKDIDTAAWLLN
jgi:hypothetical protein